MEVDPTFCYSNLPPQEIVSNSGEFEKRIYSIINNGTEALNNGSDSIQVFKSLEAYFFVFLKPISETDPFWQKQNDGKKRLFIHIADKIGRGGYKTVFKICHTYEVVFENSEAFIQNFDKQKPLSLLISKKNNKSSQSEINFLQNHKDKNIVNCIAGGIVQGVGGDEQACKEFFQGNFSNNFYPVMFMELMNQDLNDYLSFNQINLSEAIFLINQVVEGVNYLNTLGMVHPDLKLPNILVKWENGELRLKLSDFGGVDSFNTEQKICNYTPQLAAPELVFQKMFGQLENKNNFYFKSKYWKRIESDKNKWKTLKYVNYWGVGIIAHGIFTRLFIKDKSFSNNANHFPWSDDLLQLNNWAFSTMYPKGSLSHEQVRDKFKSYEQARSQFESVCEKIKLFTQPTDKKGPETNLKNFISQQLSLIPETRHYIDGKTLFNDRETHVPVSPGQCRKRKSLSKKSKPRLLNLKRSKLVVPLDQIANYKMIEGEQTGNPINNVKENEVDTQLIKSDSFLYKSQKKEDLLPNSLGGDSVAKP